MQSSTNLEIEEKDFDGSYRHSVVVFMEGDKRKSNVQSKEIASSVRAKIADDHSQETSLVHSFC